MIKLPQKKCYCILYWKIGGKHEPSKALSPSHHYIGHHSPAPTITPPIDMLPFTKEFLYNFHHLKYVLTKFEE